MFKQRLKNKETDRYIFGRSKERDNTISKYIIQEQTKPKLKNYNKKLHWNEKQKSNKIYLSLLEAQLFSDENKNNNLINLPVNSSRKQKKLDSSNTTLNNEQNGRLIIFKDVEQSLENKRKIKKCPFKVLDAPSFKDDFYLHLLDWSKKNFLAVGLGKELY